MRTKKKVPPVKVKKPPEKAEAFSLKPSFLIFCHDVLETTDGSFSIVRLIDRVRCPRLPAKFPTFKIVGEFASNQSDPATFSFQLRIIPPNEKDPMTVGPYDVNTKSDLRSNRIVLNCQNFGLSSEGIYTFELEAFDKKKKSLALVTRELEVRVDKRIEISEPTIV